MLREPEADTGKPRKNVVGAHFSAPLRPSKPERSETINIPDEYFENLDAALASKRLQGGKPA